MFAVEQYNVVPDVIGVAKSLGGGVFPIGATLYRRPLQAFVRSYPSMHLSTFGGGDIGCRVGLAVIDEIISRDLPGRARAMGARFADGFERLRVKYPAVIAGSRHLGLMLAVLYTKDQYGPAMSQLLAQQGGRCASGNQPAVMRLMPPLVIAEEQVDEVLDAFDLALATVDVDSVAKGPAMRSVGCSRQSSRWLGAEPHL